MILCLLLVEHMDMENTTENTHRKLPGENILKQFRVLAVANKNERVKATKTLLEHLQEQQSVGGKGLCGDIKYTLNRLVQGLSSDRNFARIGYSAALCQLLRTVEIIDSKDVLTCIEENAKSQHTAKASKSDERNVALGKAFGLLTLINSGKILTSSSGEISKTVEELLNLHGKKSYLQLLCLDGVLQIITQVSHDTFKKSVLPHVEKQFSSGWVDCSPDTLLLILKSYQQHPGVVKKLLNENWSGEKLIFEKNFPLLASVVTKSACQSHVIHPVIDQVLAVVQEKNLDVGKFWKQACKHLLVAEKRVRVGPKQILGLYLFEKLLPCIDSPKKLKEVMLPDMASAFIQLCSKKIEEGSKTEKKTSDTIKKASQVLADLATLTSASKDAQFQIEMLKCLITSPGSFEFDSQTNTNTVAQISSQLLPEARCEYIEELMKAFRGQSSWIVSENQSAALPQWCIKQLCLVCSNAESQWQLKILQFLFLHSFFVVKGNNKDIAHCTVVIREMTEFQRKSASDGFFKTITKLLTKHDIGVPKATNLNQHIDLLYGLSKYVQELLHAGDCVQLIKTDYQSEIVEEWNKLTDVISTINKKRNPEEILDCHAFELLFIYFGLQMFEDPQNLQESLLDLYVCYKKSTKRRMSLAKDDGPAWIDVITELLLSMMFKENSSSRVVAKQVMSYLADHVTHSTVQLIVDALEQTSLDSEEGMLGVEDDGDDDDDDDDNDQTQIDDDNVDDEDDDDDDSSDDKDDDDNDDDEDSEDSGIEEETDVVVADKLKEKLKVALGNAAGDSEEDDDDGDDDDNDVEFSDSEMFKLDSVLASAFRSMSKSKKMDKQKSKQLQDFKTRVLDLVEVIVKNQLAPGIAKGFILLLLGLVERGMRKATEESLGNKAQATLQMLLKQKKVKTDVEVDKDELLELLEHLMKCSNKVPVPSFIQDTGNACLYVLKLLLHDSGLSPLKTRSKSENKQKKPAFYKEKVEAMMRSAILDLLGHKSGHCQPAFFHMLIVKYPLIFWTSCEELTNTVKSQEAKVFDRTQAAAFLANMISKELHDSVKVEDWTKFVKSWKSAATMVINEMSCKEKFKKNLLEEVVATCNQVELTTPGQLSLDEEVLQKLLEMQKKCEKTIRKAINKLTSGMKRTNINGSEGQKNKKKNEKRKDKKDEVDGLSPPKKTKEQSASEEKEELVVHNKASVSEESDINLKHKKKKKPGKSDHQSNEDTAEILDQSITNGDTENRSVKKVVENDIEVGNTPKSQKKKKKRKSKEFSSKETTSVDDIEGIEPVVSPGSAKKAKLASTAENQSATNDTSILEESMDVSASGKKKKKNKFKKLTSE
ncbi:myb-binding protein 1A-like protein [Mercenaria mercenaria]|uniref:myb-binding protein 1A-like protein n=1 Tax=Mercenaria mercenaria TaxID=6596 RepID=UPI00234F946E|nr:myb-binding protein 1A-like protein [Mercenaria mercenaria]